VQAQFRHNEVTSIFLRCYLMTSFHSEKICSRGKGRELFDIGLLRREEGGDDFASAFGQDVAMRPLTLRNRLCARSNRSCRVTAAELRLSVWALPALGQSARRRSGLRRLLIVYSPRSPPPARPRSFHSTD